MIYHLLWMLTHSKQEVREAGYVYSRLLIAVAASLLLLGINYVGK